MERMFTAIGRYFQNCATDPAVALGLFGTGVGLALLENPTPAHGGPRTA